MLGRDVTVEYHPRSAVGEVWARDHGGQTLPVKPYAFRAYARGNKAVLFVDDTETRDSALWLLLHELAHLDLDNAPLVHRAYRSIPKAADYLRDDGAHEAHAEEQLANLVADQVAPALGGRPGLDRLWWRRRVAALGRRRWSPGTSRRGVAALARPG